MPQTFSKNKASVSPIDKDGDDTDTDVESFFVEVATNGFLLTINYEDGSTVKFIHQDFDEVLTNMRTLY